MRNNLSKTFEIKNFLLILCLLLPAMLIQNYYGNVITLESLLEEMFNYNSK